MVIKKIYDKNSHTQKIWYDSSMIFYTEMVENELENIGDLYVTFKNGARYKYSDVSFEDYLVFIGGGTDVSQGKTLNKIIKGKYEYERLEDADMEFLTEELNKEEKKGDDAKITYFISGHRNITEEEFEVNYGSYINYVIYNNPNAKFVVGDCDGTDIMAQNYLMDIACVSPDNVKVYHMFESPRNINPKIVNCVGGFKSDDERDEAMTKDSFEDIAFVRDITKISGTAKNILRRKQLIKLSDN